MLKIVQIITFFGLFAVSAGLSFLLYTGLSYDKVSYITFAILAVVVEGIKILALTWGNTSLWQANTLKQWFISDSMKGMFRFWNRKKIEDPNLLTAVLSYSKHQRRAIVMFSVYMFTAFLSVSASFGYISSTVYISTQGKEVVSTVDTQNIYREQLSSAQDIIVQDRRLIKGYETEIAKLDVLLATSELDTKLQTQYLAKKDQYQNRINANNKEISEKLKERAEINTKINELKNVEIANNKNYGKSMYQLMAEQLHTSDKTVMFVLLYMLAILIEVGLLVTAPSWHKMDAEDLSIKHPITTEDKTKTEGTSKIETKPESTVFSNAEITIVNASTEENTGKPTTTPVEPLGDIIINEPSKIVQPVDSGYLRIDPEHEVTEPVVRVKRKYTKRAVSNPKTVDVQEEVRKEPEIVQEASVLTKQVDVAINHVETMTDTNTVIIETPEPLPQPEPTITIVTPDATIVKSLDTSKRIDTFIDRLFDSTGKMVEIPELCKEIKLGLVQGLKIAEYLKQNGLVVFRMEMGWYLATDISNVKKAIGKMFG